MENKWRYLSNEKYSKELKKAISKEKESNVLLVFAENLTTRYIDRITTKVMKQEPPRGEWIGQIYDIGGKCTYRERRRKRFLTKK